VLKKKKKAAVGRICRKKGFKSGMKERVGDEKLIIIIISVAVRGINGLFIHSKIQTTNYIVTIKSYIHVDAATLQTNKRIESLVLRPDVNHKQLTSSFFPQEQLLGVHKSIYVHRDAKTGPMPCEL